MRKILLTAVLINGAALALLLAACKAPDGAETARGGANAAATPAEAKAAPGANAAAPVKPPANIVRRLTVAEFKEMADRGEAVAVDVRTKDQFDAGHIKGALSLPRAETAQRGGQLPKDKLLVFYCA